MLVTLSGIVMFVRLLQSAKALFPMLVTLFGIMILDMRLYEEKALSAI